MMAARNKSPFTTTQWKELEHHALIVRYMVSGVPIPRDLILTVEREKWSLNSSIYSKPLAYQSTGWGTSEMSFRRKLDPKPRRCRSTDGKKWRCLKEAHPDFNYYARHMRRNKNRLRKPAEIIDSINQFRTILLLHHYKC